MSSERNLLFGVLAVQLKLATPKQLVEAASVWASDQTRQLGDILAEQGTVTEEQREAIEGLIGVQVKAHGGDASLALPTLGGDAAVHQSFAASIVFDPQGGLEYKSIGGVTPQPEATPEQTLSDEGQLTTEHPGRYTMRGEKGRGGVGRVLIAFDEHVGREIALKELLPDSASKTTPVADSPMRRSATMTARFLREARITGQLEHPGIVPVYEVGKRPDNSTYYTMKLVRGETLADKLTKCKSIGDHLKLLPHYLDLCNAIAYAHSRGVVHRDIKPANVMVGEFGETVLLDWGLAKVKGQKDEGAEKLADEIRSLKEADASQTVEGKPIGTPSYMPPEQADGLIDEIDERSDVWSLGAVLYEILTGQPPFTGVTAYEVIGKVLSDEVAPVLEVQKDAPQELAAIAMHCLKKDRAKRYRNVETIAEDVTACQTGGMVSAYTYSTGLMFGRWVKKNWVEVGAVAAVFIVLAVALVVVLGQLKVIQEKSELFTQKNEELTHREYELLAKSMVAKTVNLQAQHKKFQVAFLLACQASNFEKQHNGKVSPTTNSTVRAILGDTGLGTKVLQGHEGGLNHVSFSPDGKLLATASNDQTVRVWQVNDLEAKPQVLSGHRDVVNHVSFSPDGKLLASASSDQSVRVWHVDDMPGESIVLAEPEYSQSQVTCSPDGERIIAVNGDVIRVWDMRIDKIIEMLEGECYRNLSWQEWQTYVGKDIPNEKTIERLPLGKGVPHEGAVASQVEAEPSSLWQ